MKLKRLEDFLPGDCFLADILDIAPGIVTLEFADGEAMTVRSLILPDARIGERRRFIVTENAGGQILLEMLKAGEETGTSRRAIDVRV